MISPLQIYARFGFLHARFDYTYFFWEIILLVRNAIFTFTLVLLDQFTAVQMMVTTFFILCALLLHAQKQPFIYRYLNSLESVSLMSNQV